ncbi:MFS transporter [Ideonella sp. A 288]|uniref:MFS transporter n=1 Tax=Ideonella sp. A 288 TaxID=1962181 RepID=UPI000B4B0E53|nr:MFS transporter [Ideonella sp. A 288]
MIAPAGAGAGRPPLPAFAAVWCAYFAAIGLFNPYAPLWYRELGLSTLAIGAMASLQSWTRVVAPYAWGWLGDHGGRRAELVRWAAALALASALGLLVARGHLALAVFTALLFLANGGIVPLAEAALAQHLSRGGVIDMARYGRVRVWGSLGFIVSVSLFGVLLERFGIGGFPWYVALIFGAVLAAAWRLPSAPAAVAAHGAPVSVLGVLRQPAVAWFFAGTFLHVLAHAALYTFFSLYLVDLGHGKGAVGALWAVSVAVEIVFFWTQGRWFGRLSLHGWLELAALMAALRFAATAALGGHVAVLVAAQALHAITFAAQHAACIAFVDRHFPGAMRGRGQALYSMIGYGFSGVLGGLAGGWLSNRHGFAAVFWAAAGCAVLAWGALRLSRWHEQGRTAPLRPA